MEKLRKEEEEDPNTDTISFKKWKQNFGILLN